jgi:hypothetical protein
LCLREREEHDNHCVQVLRDAGSLSETEFDDDGTPDQCEDGPWADGYSERCATAESVSVTHDNMIDTNWTELVRHRERGFTIKRTISATTGNKKILYRNGYRIVQLSAREHKAGQALDNMWEAAIEEMLVQTDMEMLGGYAIETHTVTVPENLEDIEVVRDGWKPALKRGVIDSGTNDEDAPKKKKHGQKKPKLTKQQKQRRFQRRVYATTSFEDENTESMTVSESITYRTDRARKLLEAEARDLKAQGLDELPIPRARYYAAVFEELTRQRKQVEKFDAFYAAQDTLRAAKQTIAMLEQKFAPQKTTKHPKNPKKR